MSPVSLLEFRTQELHDDNKGDLSPRFTGESHSSHLADRPDVMDSDLMIPKSWSPEGNVPIRLSPEELSLCYQGRRFDSFFDPNNHAFTPRHERRPPVCDRNLAGGCLSATD